MTMLRRMEAPDTESVLALAVSEEQLAYVDPLAKTLAITDRRVDNHVVLADGEVVGFFQIRRNLDDSRTKPSLAVEELSIDVRHQGKGYGKAMIEQFRGYLASEYPGWPLARLTVNFKNARAYRLYRHGGFIDTGEVDNSGRSGPQHVMILALAGPHR